MALEGTLRDFSLADIFQLIGLQRKTGVLTLRSPEDVVSISFLEGRVVGADSLNKRLEDRLGQVLLKTGAISPDELEKALKVQMETLERLGHILIRHDVISRDELRHAIEQQILQIIYRVFRWQDGDYHFSQETSIDYDHELVTPLGAESILMEGARMLDEWPIIEKRIPHRGIVFVPAPAARSVEVTADEELVELGEFEFDLEDPPAPAPVAGRVRVSAMEREVLDLLDGRSSVDDVIKKSPASEFETCKALYALLSRALIREASREELAEARLRAEAPATLAPSQATRLPWLAIALVPLLVFSQLLVPRNPLNALLGPGPKIMPRIQHGLLLGQDVGNLADAAGAGRIDRYLPRFASGAGARRLPRQRCIARPLGNVVPLRAAGAVGVDGWQHSERRTRPEPPPLRPRERRAGRRFRRPWCNPR